MRHLSMLLDTRPAGTVCPRGRLRALIAAVGLFVAPTALPAALVPGQVLVVYNSAVPDSVAVWQHYEAARPGVRGFDLADPGLAPGTVSYPDFVSRIRNPLRAHLAATSLEGEIVVFVLTKGLPHRILDLNGGGVGDNPGAASGLIDAGNASYASVDSELTLLWQDLEGGEGGGSMDSAADNNVLNPYFNLSTPISGYSRAKITAAKKFQATSGPRWRMLERNNGPAATPGDIYLTTRLDGNSVEAVRGMIDRGLAACYDSSTDAIIQDKSASNGTIDSGDYTLTQILVADDWPAFTYEQTDTFLIGLNGNLAAGNAGTQRFGGRVAALTGYGGNHSGGSKAGFMGTFAGQLAPGAVYNAYESFNARKFGGVGGYGGHGQLSDWVDAGGTFGVGNAWEPLASGSARNYAVLEHFFVEGRSWAEAAWSGAQYLSWQTVVLGDPLATASFSCLPVATVSASGGLCETSGSLATCTVTLSRPAEGNLQVNLSLSGADLPGDYTTSGGVTNAVTIPAGQSSTSFQLSAIPDTVPEGTEEVVVTLQAGSGYVASGPSAVVAIEDSPFGAWLVEAFAGGALGPEAGPDADPDRDGLSNLLEYSLGSSPLAPNPPPSGVGLTVEADEETGGVVSIFRYRRDPSKVDLVHRVESSSDLQGWTTETDLPAGSDGNLELREVRRPVSPTTRRFYRLVVELQPVP